MNVLGVLTVISFAVTSIIDAINNGLDHNEWKNLASIALALAATVYLEIDLIALSEPSIGPSLVGYIISGVAAAGGASKIVDFIKAFGARAS